MARKTQYDFVVVGSGIAGSFAALHLSRAGRVLLLTKTDLAESNTVYAQGGIAAALGEGDSPEAHFKDTIEAGRGLCEPEAVRVLTEEGPARVKELVALGVRFDREGGSLALGREAAHSAARIVHAGGDTTGAEIQRGLHHALLDASVDIREGRDVLRLLVEDGACVGLLAQARERIEEYQADSVLLAAGGGGRLFSHTTNPPTANADGAALAYEAGAELADMEFFQFHPTALRRDGADGFLISEAVRGEGGVLRNHAGERFMEGHPQAELAPRDVVSRAIWTEMDREHSDSVFLDLRHLPADKVRSRFPQIYATCLRHGIDITADLIPVAPAAHYMIGGVKTDLDGATSLPGLFACGEVACSGVHGANRLASNSLLESIVFARRAARAASRRVAVGAAAGPDRQAGSWSYQGRRERSPLPVPLVAAGADDIVDYQDLPDLMWRYAGLARDRGGLHEALEHLGDGSTSRQHLVAMLMCQAALLREESRGAHFRSDHPDTHDSWRGRIVLHADQGAMFETL